MALSAFAVPVGDFGDPSPVGVRAERDLRRGGDCQRRRASGPDSPPGSILAAQPCAATRPADVAGDRGSVVRAAGQRSYRSAAERRRFDDPLAGRPGGWEGKPRVDLVVRNAEPALGDQRFVGAIAASDDPPPGSRYRRHHPCHHVAYRTAAGRGRGVDRRRFHAADTARPPDARDTAGRNHRLSQCVRLELENRGPAGRRDLPGALYSGIDRQGVADASGRDSGCDRDPRHPCRVVVACHAVGARGRTAHAVQQQPQTNRAGPAQLPRHLRRVPARGDRAATCAPRAPVQLAGGDPALPGTAELVRPAAA